MYYYKFYSLNDLLDSERKKCDKMLQYEMGSERVTLKFIEEEMQRYLYKMKVPVTPKYVSIGYTSGTPCICLLTFLVYNPKAKGKLKKGYQLAYTYNVNNPNYSELGEIYIYKDEDEDYVRRM